MWHLSHSLRDPQTTTHPFLYGLQVKNGLYIFIWLKKIKDFVTYENDRKFKFQHLPVVLWDICMVSVAAFALEQRSSCNRDCGLQNLKLLITWAFTERLPIPVLVYLAVSGKACWCSYIHFLQPLDPSNPRGIVRGVMFFFVCLFCFPVFSVCRLNKVSISREFLFASIRDLTYSSC